MAVQKIDDTVVINGSKYRTISSDELRLASYQMGEQIHKECDNDFCLLSIGHGGNDIAGYIVDYFRSIKNGNWEPHVFYVVTKSYGDNVQTDEFEMSQKLGKGVRKHIADIGLHVVVTDDVFDSGNTFGEVKEYVQEDVYGGGETDKIKSAAFVKESSKFSPDFTPEKKVPRDLWLIFPRERGESGRIILRDHGLKDGIKGMYELGYDMGLVDNICRNSRFEAEEYQKIVYKIFTKNNGGNIK
ncbi:MAG: hypothetical protein ISS95_00745 [Candidatus Aenigmarchaeota archaeon]|nr:hypothetical protein [Candidatus Aenigmarchaeota archaeon]